MMQSNTNILIIDNDPSYVTELLSFMPTYSLFSFSTLTNHASLRIPNDLEKFHLIITEIINSSSFRFLQHMHHLLPQVKTMVLTWHKLNEQEQKRLYSYKTWYSEKPIFPLAFMTTLDQVLST